MIRLLWTLLLIPGLCLAASAIGSAGTSGHPRLLMTPTEVKLIRENLGHYPLYDAAYNAAKAQVDKALHTAMDVPIPRDAAGYTHERHKKNYNEMQLAGFLYQVSGEVRYANFVRDMLLRYADLYPTLVKHPAAKSSSPGKIFWQSLNEAVWLVNTSQAYDCIYDYLTAEQRAKIEAGVFRPMARFFSVDAAHEFDRIHNHGTWAVTAVGMIGYAMGDEVLVDKALRGSKRDGVGGYLRQLDELISPDGFYCEGPYYGRYALMPFFTFAKVVQNNQPELGIFKLRNGLLGRALEATLQQSWVNGAFLPLNDALKEKTILSPEILFAVATTYVQYGRAPHLLAIAKRQGGVVLDASGLELAKALAETKSIPEYAYASMELRDGMDGSKGGVAMLRSSPGMDQSLAVLKYTAFGMEHGHYDKLSLCYYDQGHEIIQDYGSARFLNIEQKFGGRYLPENASFAKQTIGHNTVVVDETSHYAGKYDTAEHKNSERVYFSAEDPAFQYVSALDRTAVPGVTLQRTIAMIQDAKLEFPVVADVIRVVSSDKHHYDLPYYFQGTFLQTNAQITRNVAQLLPFGKKAGYQHLWLEAEGAAKGPISFTWFNGDRYYTLSSSATPSSKVALVRIGANDPNFNLRPEMAFVLREDAASHVFASVIEPHGKWDGTKEFTYGCFPKVLAVKVLASTEVGIVVRIEAAGNLAWTLMIANQAGAANAEHRIEASGVVYEWKGNALLLRPEAKN